jgi:hypothetical protein
MLATLTLRSVVVVVSIMLCRLCLLPYKAKMAYAQWNFTAKFQALGVEEKKEVKQMLGELTFDECEAFAEELEKASARKQSLLPSPIRGHCLSFSRGDQSSFSWSDVGIAGSARQELASRVRFTEAAGSMLCLDHSTITRDSRKSPKMNQGHGWGEALAGIKGIGPWTMDDVSCSNNGSSRTRRASTWRPRTEEGGRKCQWFRSGPRRSC